ELFGVDAPHGRVAPDLRAAGEHDALRALAFGERVLGVLELVHVAIEQLALAGAAVSGLARERESDAGTQQRLENRVAGLRGDRLVVAFESDLHAPSGRASMLAPGLLKSQIVWVPNKNLTDGCWRRACCPGCSATGCGLRSRPCSATSRAASPSSRPGAWG